MKTGIYPALYLAILISFLRRLIARVMSPVRRRRLKRKAMPKENNRLALFLHVGIAGTDTLDYYRYHIQNLPPTIHRYDALVLCDVLNSNAKVKALPASITHLLEPYSEEKTCTMVSFYCRPVPYPDEDIPSSILSAIGYSVDSIYGLIGQAIDDTYDIAMERGMRHAN